MSRVQGSERPKGGTTRDRAGDRAPAWLPAHLGTRATVRAAAQLQCGYEGYIQELDLRLCLQRCSGGVWVEAQVRLVTGFHLCLWTDHLGLLPFSLPHVGKKEG